MSSEVYLGEVDCRRIESLQCAVESLTAALVESQNTSTNNAMDAILVLYKRWEATTPKVHHVWGVQEFVRWAQEQHQ